ncbi:hypothetical protein ABC382_00230 [Lysinibacillus sp. 1P01SD]|uniref:hypothetical protein n=1 Tax=Lysinibacillus sp. 1P01SD TaxID=3132285 RepID=UPI0039A19871
MDFMTRTEAQKALEVGKRVYFHWRGKSVEVNKETTLADLRWALADKKAVFALRVVDVTNGHYSII